MKEGRSGGKGQDLSRVGVEEKAKRFPNSGDRVSAGQRVHEGIDRELEPHLRLLRKTPASQTEVKTFISPK